MLSISSIACIVVNYNGLDTTLACLEALLSLSVPPRCICVVDNGSLHGESDALLRAWGQLCRERALAAPVLCPSQPDAVSHGHLLLPLAENRGFAAGNNAALRMLLTDPECQAFWLLNNDTLPRPDALEALVHRMNQRPDAGIVGSTLIRVHTALPRDPMVQTAAGVALNPLTGITRPVLAGLSLPRLSAYDVRAVENRLAAITGASCLVHRTALERVGLMDEGFFLYFEDVDWGLRFRKAGYALVWAKDSVVAHEEGGSAPRGDAARAHAAFVDYLSYRNRLRLMFSHYPLGVPITVLSFAYAFCKRMLHGKPEKALLVTRAFSAALRGERGRPAGMP